MIQQSFEQLVESLAAKTPTPGGGAAAALAGCMGTSLFLMVVRFSRGKKANLDRDEDLARVEGVLDGHLRRLLPMADRDCRSFDLVSAAYGMPKDGDEQKALREKAIQEAMVGAMVVPEETLCMVRDVFVAMESVIPCIGKAIVSDLASGASLLLAAAEGAFLNVRINATYLTNRDLADRTMERATSVLTEIRRHQGSIAVSVDKMLS
ncbi:MAG: cyclodeaminase/cyclohydrolase family protein [Planctomycetes bacterium]|jgi:formiminotetrahydrofolate cyclodeaminase|nr:cyclodeaminase/cyclohydrolase family protein [Planctomycetota bacterium]MCC7062908.1 cyclodeaminase/cyclohydrolase family protein [Planctomycetota bacterium]